jgi:hypothetical protein
MGTAECSAWDDSLTIFVALLARPGRDEYRRRIAIGINAGPRGFLQFLGCPRAPQLGALERIPEKEASRYS